MPTRTSPFLAALALCLLSACSSDETGAPGSGGENSLGVGGGGSGGSSAGFSAGASSTSGSAGTAAGDGPANAGSSGSGQGGVTAGASGDSSGSGAGAGGSAASGGVAGGSVGGAGGIGGGGGNPNPLLDRNEVLRLTRLVADYYLGTFGTNYDNSWIRSTFYDGLMAAYRTTADDKYLTAARTWGEKNAWKQPTTASIDSNGQPRHADNQNCFQTYAEVYLTNPVPANDPMLATAVSVFDTMVASPNNAEWTWADALFMAPPAMVRVASAKSKTAYVSLMHKMWSTTQGNLYNKAEGLFWRDSNAKTNTPNTYWARGNGWVVGGSVRVLEYLPASDTNRINYESLLQQMAAALKPLQGSDGLWRSDLKNPNAYPNPEASGTLFFCYAIAWGINHGLLDRTTYQGTALKAWNGVVSVALNPTGMIGYVQTVARAPGAAKATDTRDYAGGEFLLAASEMIKL